MMGESTRRQLPFRLLSNSRDFLERAVAEVDGGRSSVDASVVVHVATAVELVLKARLALEDPALIARDSGRPDTTAFGGPRFRSVNVPEALKRLQERGIVLLTDHQKEQLALLRSIRNALVHHVDTTEQPRIEGAIGAGFDLWIEVHDSAFCGDEVYRARPISETISDLVRFQAFVTERTKRLQQRLEHSVRPITHYFDECSTCLQDATVIVQNRLRCLFCRHEESIRGCAEVISDDRSVEKCGRCGYNSVVKHTWRSGETTIACICCGFYQGRRILWCEVPGKPLPYLKEGVIGPPVSARPLPTLGTDEITRGGREA